MARAKRLKRFKKDEMHLEINSLLDILVILLVFLIKNFSATHIDIPIPKELVIPTSKSIDQNSEGITISLDRELNIYLNEDELGQIPLTQEKMIDDLYNRLLVEKSRIDSTKLSEGKVIDDVINLVFDERLEYVQIKKILYTVKEAGFKEYKFVVTQ